MTVVLIPGKIKTSGNLSYSFLSVQTDIWANSWLFFHSRNILELNKQKSMLFGIWVIGLMLSIATSGKEEPVES